MLHITAPFPAPLPSRPPIFTRFLAKETLIPWIVRAIVFACPIMNEPGDESQENQADNDNEEVDE